MDRTTKTWSPNFSDGDNGKENADNNNRESHGKGHGTLNRNRDEVFLVKVPVCCTYLIWMLGPSGTC